MNIQLKSKLTFKQA